MSLRQALGRLLRSPAWRIGRFVVGLGVAALVLVLLNGQRNELVGASKTLAHLRPGWLLLAIASEVACYLSFAALQRRLLHAGNVEVGLGSIAGLTVAAAAIANSVPAGPAVSGVYAFHQYRRRGADEALAGWTLVAALVCAALTLGLLATAGTLLALRQGASYGLIGVIFGVLVVATLVDAVVWQRRWLAHVIIALLGLARRLTGRPHGEAVAVVNGWFARLADVRLSWRDLAATLGFGLGQWVFDCACLAFSFVAVGVAIPWRGLLLAYGAGQLALNLPITPGGLGVVEGSLTVALVTFGGAELATVAAVLCYRLVSFWGLLPVGWLVWLFTTLRHRRDDARARSLSTVTGDGPGSLSAAQDDEAVGE